MIIFTDDYSNPDPNVIASGYIGKQKNFRITKTADGRFLGEKKKKNGEWIEVANSATPEECKQDCIKHATEKALGPEKKRSELRAKKYDKNGRLLFDVGERQNWLA